MHELHIVESLVMKLQDISQREKPSKIVTAQISIGALTQVTPESFTHYFQILTKDTELAEVKLHLQMIPVRILCPFCQKQFEITHDFFQCPQCLLSDVKIIAGQEMMLNSIELGE